MWLGSREAYIQCAATVVTVCSKNVVSKCCMQELEVHLLAHEGCAAQTQGGASTSAQAPQPKQTALQPSMNVQADVLWQKFSCAKTLQIQANLATLEKRGACVSQVSMAPAAGAPMFAAKVLNTSAVCSFIGLQMQLLSQHREKLDSLFYVPQCMCSKVLVPKNTPSTAVSVALPARI